MRSLFAPLLLATALAGCATAQPGHFNDADRGLSAVNVPVLGRTDYVFDAAAPGGSLAAGEAQRLDAWFRGLGLGYGDSVHVDGGAYADGARSEIAQVAGQYGLIVQPGAPVTAGQVGPGNVRVVVSRATAGVPGCPNWSGPSQPNYSNRTMPNFGCAVNGNLAAMVANPRDLFYGTPGPSASDGIAAAKAVQMYRDWPLTGVTEGQAQRPLKSVQETTKGE